MRTRAKWLVAFVAGTLVAASSPRRAANPGRLWRGLEAGNARFASGQPRARELTTSRARLTTSQSPDVAVLACSDSRVAPELVFDQSLGDLFVVRNAGNSPEPDAVGSLEYAVDRLGVGLVVVLGHEDCGAVKAACSGARMPTASLEVVVRPIRSSCPASPKPDLDLAAKDHARRAAAELLAKSPVLRRAVEEKKLAVVAAYYSLETGRVQRVR